MKDEKTGKELENYFPLYKKDQKKILVKLRNEGEMTNYLYDIFENKQEN